MILSKLSAEGIPHELPELGGRLELADLMGFRDSPDDMSSWRVTLLPAVWGRTDSGLSATYAGRR